MRIIFMGTPDFAVPTLQKLIDNKNFEIVAIYTREPQIAGRGHKLTNSPIHELALKYNLKVVTPKTLRNKENQQEFANFKADAAVVVAYGLILPTEILTATKFGCLNIHPSILPRWRGPSPIQYTLFSGDKEIGVTIIKMNENIDSGDIILQEKFNLTAEDKYNNLAPKLADIGARMMINSLKDLQNNLINFSKQDENLATFSKKLQKEDSRINWQLSAEEILRKINGLSGFLTANFIYNGDIIKIYSAEIIEENNDKKYGEISLEKDRIIIKCGRNSISPLMVQKAGKKIITAKDFIMGLSLN